MTFLLILFIVISIVLLVLTIKLKKSNNEISKELEEKRNKVVTLVEDLKNANLRTRDAEDKLQAFEITYSELDKRYTKLQKEYNKLAKVNVVPEIKETKTKSTKKATTKKAEEKETKTRKPRTKKEDK